MCVCKKGLKSNNKCFIIYSITYNNAIFLKNPNLNCFHQNKNHRNCFFFNFLKYTYKQLEKHLEQHEQANKKLYNVCLISNKAF